jgi:hypothetical protein
MEAARLTTVLDAQADNLFSTLRNATSAGQAFALAMGASLAAVGAASIKVGLVMDDALDTIRIRTGQTGKALEGLGESFSDVFRAGPDGAQQVSEALTTLRQRTGQAGDGLEALTSQVLTLSRITGTDLNANVSESARVFTSWGVAVSDQAATLDMVFRTYQQTGVGVDTLLSKLITAGPTFRAAGFDIATSAALLGGFEQAGVSAERVVASMTAAWRFFGKNQIDAQKGIRETIARIQELGPGAEAAALGVKVFGRGAVDMVAAIQSGRLNVEALAASIANGTDTIESARRATDGFVETLATLRNRATQALEPFGTAILETFNDALVGLMAPSRALIAALDLLAKAVIAVSVAVSTKLVVSIVRATSATLANALANHAARVANVQTTAAIAAQAQAQFIAATAALNAARAETALTGSLVAQRAALVAVSTAHAQAAGATAAHTAAIRAASISARVGAASVGLLRGALAFFGGPWGLAITAVLTGVGIAFYNTGRRARQAAAEARQAAEDFRAALAGMNEAALAATFVSAGTTRSAIVDQIRSINALLERQRRHVEALREAGVRPIDERLEARGLVTPTPEQRDLRTLTAAITRNEQALSALRGVERRYGQQVSETSAELERRRRLLDGMNALAPSAGPGPLDWEGASAEATQAARGGVEVLRERLDLLSSVVSTERILGRDATAAQRALSAEYERAESLLRSMGDAAHLPAEALQSYRDLLDVVNSIRPATLRPTVTLQAARPGIDLGAAAAQVGAQNTRAAATFVAQQASRIQQALDEGARKAAERLREAASNLRSMLTGVLDSLPGVRNARVGFEAAQASGKSTAASVFSGAKFAVAMEFLTGMANALGPALSGLLYPVQLVGELFGNLLAPVARLLFQPLRLLAIGFTYLQTALGWLIRGIGKMIDAIPGISGGPLIRAGQNIMDGAESVRRRLENLDFNEAVDAATNSARNLAESLSNVPPVFDLALRRMQAGRAAGTPTPSPAPAPPLQPGTGGSGGQPINIIVHNTYQIDGRGAASDRELLRLIDEHQARKLLGGDSALRNAVRTAALASR